MTPADCKYRNELHEKGLEPAKKNKSKITVVAPGKSLELESKSKEGSKKNLGSDVFASQHDLTKHQKKALKSLK